jgi:hypothetical protein
MRASGSHRCTYFRCLRAAATAAEEDILKHYQISRKSAKAELLEHSKLNDKLRNTADHPYSENGHFHGKQGFTLRGHKTVTRACRGRQAN